MSDDTILGTRAKGAADAQHRAASPRIPTPPIAVARHVDADPGLTGRAASAGLDDYLAGMSLLAEGSGRQGPGGLTPAEVRRFTGNVRAVSATPSPKALAPAVSPGARKARTRVWLPLTALLAVSGFALARSDARLTQPIPDAMLGRWVARDARYAGRVLEFSRDSVRITVAGTGGPETHPILGVEGSSDRVEGGGRYIVDYGTDAARGTIRVVLFTGVRPELRMDNPYDVVWVHPERGSASHD